MATRIGSAYIDVDANTDKFEKATGKLAGFARGAGKAVLGIAAGVGVVGVAVAGLALKGGLDRALNIEDAQKKLEGLGHSAAAIDDIMTSALDSVKGTAFGLDSAATLAASAVAAGIEPGEELTRVLKVMADTATIAGAPLDEIGAIFNKVAAGGRLTAREINQLTQRGVPALQFLSEHLGITVAEVQEMVSAGEISFETFAAAMEENLGGAALKSGETVRGAAANMGAALSRLGAKVITPLLPVFTRVFGGITTILDNLASKMDDKIIPFIERVADAFLEGESLAESFGNALREMFSGIGRLSHLWDVFREGEGVIDGLRGVLESLSLGGLFEGQGIGDFFSGLLDSAVEVFGRVVDWLADEGIPMILNALVASRERLLEAALILFPAIVDGLVQIIPALLDSIVNVLLPAVVEFLTGAVPDLLEAAVELFTALVEAIVVIVPELASTLFGTVLPAILTAVVGMVPSLLTAAISLFTTLVDAIVTILPQLVQTLFGVVLPGLLTALVTMIPQLLTGAVELFRTLLEAVVTILPDLIGVLLGELLPAVLMTILEMIPELLETAVELFTSLVEALVEIIPDLLSTLLGVVLPALVITIVSMAPEILTAAITALLAMVEALLKVLPELLTTLLTRVLPALVVAIIAMAPDLVVAAIKAFFALVDALQDTIPQLVGTIVTEVIPGIIKAFGELGPALFQAGVNALGDLLGGIRKKAGEVISWVRNNVVNRIKRLWPFSPAKEGPFAGRGSPLHAGENIMGLLAEGIRKGTGDVLAAASDVTSLLSGGVTGVPVAAVAGSSRMVNYNITMESSGQPEVDAQYVGAVQSVLRRVEGL